MKFFPNADLSPKNFKSTGLVLTFVGVFLLLLAIAFVLFSMGTARQFKAGGKN